MTTATQTTTARPGILTEAGQADSNCLREYAASRGDDVWQIRRPKNGAAQLYCTWPSWKFQRKPVADRMCKHLTAFAGEVARAA